MRSEIKYLLVAIVSIAITLIVLSFKKKQNLNYKINDKSSLYNRLGGIYAISAVVNHFSDNILKNPLVGMDSPNEQLRNWSRTQSETRLPGLKFLRTLWVADITGGPYTYVGTKRGKCPMSLENAHKDLKISPEEFDAVAKELSNSLDHFGVPEKEKNEVLSAFAGHKAEVNQGFVGNKLKLKCPFAK